MHPFSAKSRAFIKRHPSNDKRYNILCGSVRSGKTWTMLAKLLLLRRQDISGLRVIVGQLGGLSPNPTEAHLPVT
jgi:hypothetical protein